MKTLSILFSLVLLTLGCSQTPEERLQSMYEEGLGQVGRQEFSLADSTFTKIGIEFGNTYVGQFGLGLSLERRLLYFDAIRSYVEVIKNAPAFSPLSQALGRAFGRVGDFEEAAKAYSNYTAVEPDNQMAHFESARAYFANSQLELAQSAIDRAIANNLDERLSNLFTARLHFATNQSDKAAKLLAEGMDGLRSDPLAYREIADYYEHRGMADSSIHYSRQSAKLAESDIDLELDHFYRTLRLNYFFAARHSLKRFLARENSGTMVSALEVAYYRATDDGSRASKTSMVYRQLYPEALTPIVLDIHTRWMIKDAWSIMEDRGKIMQEMKKREYDPSFQSFMQGRMTLEFSEYTEMDIDLAALRKSAGWILKQREHMLEELFMMSMSGAPDSVDASVEGLLVSHGLQSEWLSGIGDIYADWRTRDYDRAVELYSEALTIRPLYIPAYEHWVAMEMQMENWDAALKVMATYPKFVRLVPTSAMQKVITLLELGKWSQAVSLAKETLPALAGDIDRFSEIEKMLHFGKRFDDAETVMVLLRDLSDDNPDGLARVASFYADRDDEGTTLTLVDAGLTLEPENTELLVQKARGQIKSGQREQGLALLEELYAKEPGNSEVLIYLSRSMSSEKKLLRKAVNLARSAIFFDQLSIKARLNLSYVYWQMERYDLAKGEARNAISLDKTNPNAYYWFGRALFKLGDDEALGNLSKAVEFGLSGVSLKDAQGMLSRL